MTGILSTNIISPLGLTSQENYRAVREGRTALVRHDGLFRLPEPFAASLFTPQLREALSMPGFTFFEALCIRSAREALSHTSIDVASEKVLFILSTIKAGGHSPADSARHIARALGITTTPITVCNACVSGLSAQLLAHRLLRGGKYDAAIVVGAEEQTRFIVAGFQSLKVVSDEPCRPFDIERTGLNLGEAAATIIFGSQASEGSWALMAGAARGDAHHVSSPSPTGNGLFSAIAAVMQDFDKSQLSQISAHGTATLFNDQMEAKALRRAGLADVPLSALKGYFGHTMGAAGLLEVIITMLASDDHLILPTRGFAELGVSENLSLSNQPRHAEQTAFLKLLSGFGGINVAALYARSATEQRQEARSMMQVRQVRLTSLPEKAVCGYPRYYKMDLLSQLAFVASERLKGQGTRMAEEQEICLNGQCSMVDEPDWQGESTAIVLMGHSSSIVSDRKFLDSIDGEEGFFPSPAAFVYTLPSTAATEIAIRNSIFGEACFYLLPAKDPELMQQIIEATALGGATNIIGGWVDAEDTDRLDCQLTLYTATPSTHTTHNS